MRSPLHDQHRAGGGDDPGAVGVAVDRGGRRRNHGRHPVVFRRDEYLDGAGHVRFVRGKGVLHRPGRGGDRRLMKDAVRPREDFHQEVKIGDASFDELHPRMVEEMLDLHPVARLSMITTSWC